MLKLGIALLAILVILFVYALIKASDKKPED